MQKIASVRLMPLTLATLALLPGRLVARGAGLPPESDHEQILSMFANTAFWTLVGVIAVIVMV